MFSSGSTRSPPAGAARSARNAARLEVCASRQRSRVRRAAAPRVHEQRISSERQDDFDVSAGRCGQFMTIRMDATSMIAAGQRFKIFQKNRRGYFRNEIRVGAARCDQLDFDLTPRTRSGAASCG